eukprot:3308842-Alexandrium_andersonii.AAC.1
MQGSALLPAMFLAADNDNTSTSESRKKRGDGLRGPGLEPGARTAVPSHPAGQPHKILSRAHVHRLCNRALSPPPPARTSACPAPSPP